VGLMHARLRWGVRRVAVIDIDAHFGNGTAGMPMHFFCACSNAYAYAGKVFSLQPAGCCCSSCKASCVDTTHARTHARTHAHTYASTHARPHPRMLELLQEDEESFFGSVHLHVPSSPSPSSSFSQGDDHGQVVDSVTVGTI
jgi:hypothetical protein